MASACRGVGCIFYEMAAGRPLFPGSTVEDELHLIFRLLGERRTTAAFFFFFCCCSIVTRLHICSLWPQARPRRGTGRESPLSKSLNLTTSPNTSRSRSSTTLPGTCVRACVHRSDRKSYGTFPQAAIRFLPRPNGCAVNSSFVSCRVDSEGLELLLSFLRVSLRFCSSRVKRGGLAPRFSLVHPRQ